MLTLPEKYQIKFLTQYLLIVNRKRSNNLHLLDDLKQLQYEIYSHIDMFTYIFIWYDTLLELEGMKYSPEELYCAGKECCLAGKDMQEGFYSYLSFRETQKDIELLYQLFCTLHRFLSSILKESGCQSLIQDYTQTYREVNGVLNKYSHCFFNMGYLSVGKEQNESSI